MGGEATPAGADQFKPLSEERDTISLAITLKSSWSSTRAKIASRTPFGSTRISPARSRPLGGAKAIVVGADQLAPPSIVRENWNRLCSGNSNNGSKSVPTTQARLGLVGSAGTTPLATRGLAGAAAPRGGQPRPPPRRRP